MKDPRIVVCLTTCDRPEYTRRTLEAFARWNDVRRFRLVYADDASRSKAVRDLPRQYGYTRLVHTRSRVGGHLLRAALVWQVRRLAPWVLVLENDVEAVRPIPWPLVWHCAAIPWIYCLRLYGAFKDRDRLDACLTAHRWREGTPPVRWKPLRDAPEPAEIAQIHWSAQPSLTRTEALVNMYAGHRELRAKTARVCANVFYHFGTARTARTA